MPHDPRAALASPGLAGVCARVAALAHRHFARRRRGDGATATAAAMRPARLMGATYAALLDAAASGAAGSGRPSGSACRHGRSSGSRCATGCVMIADAMCHVIGAGARRAVGGAVPWPSAGARSRLRGRAAGGRAVPVLFRPRAWLPDRQRQPPAALRQPRGVRLPRPDRRARHAGRAGRAVVPVHRPRAPASAGRCGPTPGGCPGGFSPPPPGAGDAAARLSRLLALRRAGAGRDRRAALAATARSTTACSSRWRSPR